MLFGSESAPDWRAVVEDERNGLRTPYAIAVSWHITNFSSEEVEGVQNDNVTTLGVTREAHLVLRGRRRRRFCLR
jgi:hypothetical protein